MSVIHLAAPDAGGGLAGTVADFATKIMDVLGSPGAGLANALDSIIPVLPSEVILPLAGFAASRGSINLYAALVWTTIGSIVGSVTMYYIGAAFGRERVLALAARIPLVKPEEIERTEAWFRRHGTKTVFLGRMVPVFRSLISIPAGVHRMPMGTFVLYTALGSVIWNTIFVLAGYQLGENWPKVEEYGGIFSKVVIGLIVLAVGYFVVSRLLRRRRESRQGQFGVDHAPPGAPERYAVDDAPYGGPERAAEQPHDRVPAAQYGWPAREASPEPGPAEPGPPEPGQQAFVAGRRYPGTVYGTPRHSGGPVQRGDRAVDGQWHSGWGS